MTLLKRTGVVCMVLVMGLVGVMGAHSDDLSKIYLGSPLPNAKGVYYQFKKEGEKDPYAINVRVINNHFYMFVLNGKKEVIKPPFSKATLRVRTTKKVVKNLSSNRTKKEREEQFLALRPMESGVGLYSPRYIAPPSLYWIITTLFEKRGREDVKLHTFKLKRLNQVGSDDKKKENLEDEGSVERDVEKIPLFL